MHHSEFHDAYEDAQRIQGTLFSTTVGELTMCPPVPVEATAAVADAIMLMNERHGGCVLVMRGGRLAGIFTERDVLTRVVLTGDARKMKVSDVMTPNPETLEANDNIAYALNKMSVGGYRHVPIVDGDGMPLGVLSVRNIVDFLAELFPEDVLNLPPTPALGIARSADEG